LGARAFDALCFKNKLHASGQSLMRQAIAAELGRLSPTPPRGKTRQYRGDALRVRADRAPIAIHRAQLVEHLVQSRKIALAIEPVARDDKLPWARSRFWRNLHVLNSDAMHDLRSIGRLLRASDKKGRWPRECEAHGLHSVKVFDDEGADFQENEPPKMTALLEIV
jgi:hypothetical protein